MYGGGYFGPLPEQFVYLVVFDCFIYFSQCQYRAAGFLVVFFSTQGLFERGAGKSNCLSKYRHICYGSLYGGGKSGWIVEFGDRSDDFSHLYFLLVVG